MLSSLLRSQKSRASIRHSTFSSRYNAEESSPLFVQGRVAEQRRRLSADHAEIETYEDEDDADDVDVDVEQAVYGDEREDEDGHVDAEPLLPIFSAAHLGMPPDLSTLSRSLALLIPLKTPFQYTT